MLGSSAAIKDQPASPQPSPRTTLATCFASEASPRWIPCGERKINTRGISPPRTVGMIAQTSAVRQWLRPTGKMPHAANAHRLHLAADTNELRPRSAATYCNMSPENIFHTAFANTVRNRPITEMPLNCYVELRTDIIPSGCGCNPVLDLQPRHF